MASLWLSMQQQGGVHACVCVCLSPTTVHERTQVSEREKQAAKEAKQALKDAKKAEKDAKKASKAAVSRERGERARERGVECTDSCSTPWHTGQSPHRTQTGKQAGLCSGARLPPATHHIIMSMVLVWVEGGGVCREDQTWKRRKTAR